MKKLAALYLPLACLLVAASPAAAAGPAKRLPALTPVRSDALSRALQRGGLSEAQYALERARSLFRLGAVRREFGDVARPDPRAATPILRDLAVRLRLLAPADRATARGILARPTDNKYFDEHHYPGAAILASACDSTRPLCFHWDENPADRDSPPGADGLPATIPAGVQATMDTFAGVYDLEVLTYGFLPPLPDNTSPGQAASPETDIYLADLGGDAVPLFGYCTTDDPHFDFSSTYSYWDASAYCVVDDDFANAVYGGIDPQDALDVTAAHEFFHAIQFHYDIAEDLWLMEGTAMVMEDQYADNVNDNVNYLNHSTFTSPGTSVDRGSGGFEYGAWIFWRFLIEDRGELTNPLIIRQVWERAAAASTDTDGPGGPDTVASDQYSLQAAVNVLTSRGINFRNAFEKFAWVNRIPSSFYEEGASYPTARASAGYTLGPSRPTTDWHSYRLRHLADSYVVFKPSSGASPDTLIRVRVDLPNIGYGPEANLLVRYVGGTFRLRPIALDSAGNGSRVVSLGRGTVKEVDLVLTNASTRMSCWAGTYYSCTGVGRDDLRTYSFRANVS
jgi:hypothetical protein